MNLSANQVEFVSAILLHTPMTIRQGHLRVVLPKDGDCGNLSGLEVTKVEMKLDMSFAACSVICVERNVNDLGGKLG